MPGYKRPELSAGQQDTCRHPGAWREPCGLRRAALALPNRVSGAEELNGIAQIAEWERWTFEYLPDGTVRFSSIQ